MTSIAATATLPTWDMTGLIIETDPEGLDQAGANLSAAVGALTALFDLHEVGSGTDSNATDVANVEAILNAVNSTFHHAEYVEEILFCLASADTNDQAVQRASGLMREQRGRLNALEMRFNRWTTGLDIAELATRSPLVATHAYALRKRQRLARYQMTPDAEEIAATLGSVGGLAWAQLRDTLEAGIVGHVEIDGVMEEISAGKFEALFAQPDRDLRRRAREAQQAAYREVATSLAAAINAVKGETLLLTDRRGWSDPLEPMLVANGINQEILDALLTSVRAALPLFQRYLRALALALELPRLAIFDLGVPLGADRSWEFSEAQKFVVAQFAKGSPTLAALAEDAVQKRWIDAGPRAGKIDIAFCAGVGNGQSRILLNFAPTYVGMSTLAHELGHAYHYAILHQHQRTWLQVSPPPMTLAETASTFCEVLLQRSAAQGASPAEELSILGSWLKTITDTIFGMLSAYNLESAIFTRRQDHELTADEMNEMTVAVQTELFGDAVASYETSYMWSSWHFGQPNIWHYTFPYTFGMLFGLGLFARFQRDPEGFFARFDGLLADVSMADASTLASRFGIDLRDPAFWQEGLAVLEADIARFERLTTTRA